MTTLKRRPTRGRSRPRKWDRHLIIGVIMGTLFGLMCVTSIGYLAFEFLYYAINGEWSGAMP